MGTRVNINIPEELFNKANELVDRGMFSNLSELIREGLRKEVKQYEKQDSLISEDEKKLFRLLQKAESEGMLIDEKEMKKHGLSL